jgi:hypothetical protein
MNNSMSDHATETPPAGRRPRSWARRLVSWALALTVVAVVYIWLAPIISPRARMLWLQHRCLEYAAPAGQVVWTDRPAMMSALYQKGGGYKQVKYPDSEGISIFWPNYYLQALLAGEERKIDGYLGDAFTHGRKAGGGSRRLVAVGFDPRLGEGNTSAGFEVVVFKKVMSGGRPEEIWRGSFPLTAPGRRFGSMQIYAGQIDSADDSHFTLEYDIDGVGGVVDGWLRADDHVKLQVRSDPATSAR